MADVTFTFSGDATSLQNALNEIKGEIGKTKESVQGLAGQFAASFAAILPVLANLTAYVDSLTPTIRQFGQTLATIFGAAYRRAGEKKNAPANAVTCRGRFKLTEDAGELLPPFPSLSVG